MSEKFQGSPEQLNGNEQLKDKHEVLNSIEKAQEARHEHAENIDTIRAKAEAESNKSEEASRELSADDSYEKERPTFVNRELKNMAYKRTLNRARQQMNLPSRTLSKVVHNQAVDKISEAASKTVARPSGILAGGIAAFLGTSLFLWVSRHYGYEYNFLLFAFLFAGGFFVGLIAELVLRSIRKPSD